MCFFNPYRLRFLTAFFFVPEVQTPQVPPSLAQCLQPEQFLQAAQYSEPEQPLDSQFEAINFFEAVWLETVQVNKRNKNEYKSVFITE